MLCPKISRRFVHLREIFYLPGLAFYNFTCSLCVQWHVGARRALLHFPFPHGLLGLDLRHADVVVRRMLIDGLLRTQRCFLLLAGILPCAENPLGEILYQNRIKPER